ncbi:MAG: low temperature requirement protein A [Paracraurococcus sp.]
MPLSPHGLLRERLPHTEARVANVELFFDLVFAFTITQVSHALLHHLDLAGALRTGLLFLAVWWVWIYTAWVTNFLDADRTPVRLMLFVLMLAGLVLSMALPEAFAERGLAFAAAYAFMQVGRGAFAVWAIGPAEPALRRNFLRVLAWLALAAPFWIAGGLVEGEARLLLWVLALGIEYASPFAYFWTPGLGRSTTADWRVEGGHMAERCAGFILIALGETLLVTGESFAGLAWDAPHGAAFIIAFLGSVAMWWLYFHLGQERGAHHITRSADPGRMARLGYTYLHLPVVAGVVVAAAGDEMVLQHPGGIAAPAAIHCIIGGPALYLLGLALFKRISLGQLPLSHLVGLALLAVLATLAHEMPVLALAGLANAALILVAAWEHVSLRGHAA